MRYFGQHSIKKEHEMKLYIKICLISSLIMIGVIGTYSLIFHENDEEVRTVNAGVDETDENEIIECEIRNFVASVCDAVCPDAPYLCKVAFCSVILGRCEDPLFPNTAAEIVMTDPTFRDAFTCDYGKRASDIALMAYDDALNGFSPCPEALYYSTTDTADITLKRRQTLFQIGKYIFS